MATGVEVPRDAIAAFCRRHHITRLSFFGSALHGPLSPESDLDVLVEFEPHNVPGLAFFAMERELSELLGHKVDLNTAGFLGRHIRDAVLSEAEVQYATP